MDDAKWCIKHLNIQSYSQRVDEHADKKSVCTEEDIGVLNEAHQRDKRGSVRITYSLGCIVRLLSVAAWAEKLGVES